MYIINILAKMWTRTWLLLNYTILSMKPIIIYAVASLLGTESLSGTYNIQFMMFRGVD